MRYLLVILILPISVTLFGQTNTDPIKSFQNLVGSSWVSEGMQLGGFEGKTIHEVAWGLNGEIVKVKTFTTDPKTKEFGLRNEGVRAFNSQTNQLEFYEFDKLGGITNGTIVIDENNFHFEYIYEGLNLRDSWIYQSKDKYQFIVGIWQDGAWQKKFHETIFVRE